MRFNSSRPNDAYVCQWARSSMVRIMTCRRFGIKPLSEPILYYLKILDWIYQLLSLVTPYRVMQLVISCCLMTQIHYWEQNWLSMKHGPPFLPHADSRDRYRMPIAKMWWKNCTSVERSRAPRVLRIAIRILTSSGSLWHGPFLSFTWPWRT